MGRNTSKFGREKAKLRRKMKRRKPKRYPKPRKQKILMRGLRQQITRRSNGPKKTRQGQSKHTKFGTKVSTKYYKKKYIGQGK